MTEVQQIDIGQIAAPLPRRLHEVADRHIAGSPDHVAVVDDAVADQIRDHSGGPRGKGNIFFTGATASRRGGTGYAAFASAKFGLRAVAQATARELGPKNIHVAHLIIDAGVDTEWVRQRRVEALGPNALDDPNLLMPPKSVAESYWQLYQQPRSAWTFELEIRPFGEKW
jgi:NAD(P)-dependent dehydrogenase (short-subunit alcohol dehydrogenase family)